MARLPTDLEVGRIVKAHGLRGELLVRLITDRVERVDPGSILQTDYGMLVIARSRVHQKGFVVAFEGVDTREAAEELCGSTLFAPPISEPEVLWVHELIGASVEDIEGSVRGIVVAVEENPASDLLVLDSGALVPLTFLVERCDNRIVVDPPIGLFSLGDSGGR